MAWRCRTSTCTFWRRRLKARSSSLHSIDQHGCTLTTSSQPCPEFAETAIIGGGAVGSSIAYHLAKQGMKNVVLLEKSELTSGSTWHAAGLAALYHPGINMKRFHYYGMNLFSQLEEETGQPLSFHRPGSIRLATTETRMEEFRYQMQRQGWQKAPQKLITPDQIFDLFPLINMKGILGGLYNPYDGHIDPYSLTMAYSIGARKYGATVRTNSPITGLTPRSDGKWEVVTPQGSIVANRVVNASGFWAYEVGKLTNTELPLVPVEHQYVVTKPIKEVQELKAEPPVLRHLEGSFYMRGERGGLLTGPYEYTHKMNVIEKWITDGVPKGFGKELFQPDLDRLTDHLNVAMDLVPVLKQADIQTVVNGPIMYTPDLLPMLGPYYDQPNMWMAVGFTYGIIHSAGAGKYLSDWILKGEPPFDLIETDPNRFGSWTQRNYVFAKCRETYGMNNYYGYPKDERLAGRPTTRITPSYTTMRDEKPRRAAFSIHAGWEQPAFFTDNYHEDWCKSFKRADYAKEVERETNLVMNRAGIIDLTPFAKIDVIGKDAASFLDKMLANKLPKVGRTNISHLLSPSGKVYAELTVTRMSDDHFFLITGSGSEIHDLRWLKEYARKWDVRDIEFRNLTDEMACLSVAGPLSRQIMSKLTDQDMSGKAFPFLSAKNIHVAGVPVRALRISYTGELGWELYHPMEQNFQLYEALRSAHPEVENFGTFALNVLRLEKGFRMWSAEMNMDSNPIEAGLQNFICMDKEEFVGKSSLQQILQDGLEKRLVYLKVDVGDVDPEGNETVWCCDKVIGYTTSGAFGYSVGHGIAFAYVPPFLSVPTTQLEVELLGERRNATVLPGPPVLIETMRKKKQP